MFTHYRTKGIVLKKRERGEADLLLTVFSEEFGKIDITARAARKITSKLRAAVEAGYYTEVEFIEGKAHKTLTDAILLQKYPNILNSLAKQKILFLLLELVSDLTGPYQKDKNGFRFLKKSLEELEHILIKTSDDLPIFYLYFAWNLISHEGYVPELFSCVICEKKIKNEKLSFSVVQGGLVCGDCFQKKGSGSTIPLGIDALKALRFFLKNDWNTAKKLKMDAASLRNLRRISAYYLKSLKDDQRI